MSTYSGKKGGILLFGRQELNPSTLHTTSFWWIKLSHTSAQPKPMMVVLNLNSRNQDRRADPPKIAKIDFQEIKPNHLRDQSKRISGSDV